MYATECNHEKVALFLLTRARELGISKKVVTLRGGGGLDALALAAQSGALEIAKALVTEASESGIAVQDLLEATVRRR